MDNRNSAQAKPCVRDKSTRQLVSGSRPLCPLKEGLGQSMEEAEMVPYLIPTGYVGFDIKKLSLGTWFSVVELGFE